MNRLALSLFVTALLLGVSYGMHGPALPLFVKNEIGATYTDLGLIGAINFLPYMVIPIFVGILLDRINNRYLLVLGVLLNTVSLYLTSIANTVQEMLIYRAMVGIAHAFIWPTAESLLSADKGSRVHHISWYAMFFAVGFMAGPLVGSIILEIFENDYRLLFQLTAYVMGTMVISSLMTGRQADRTKSGGLNLKSFGHIVRFPVVVTLLLFSTSAFGIILTVYPAFLNDRGMDEIAVLILYFIFGITRVGALLVSEYLARRSVQIFVSSTVLITIGMGISAVGSTFVEFAIALLMLGFGFSMMYPLALEIILQGTRKKTSGRMIGAFEAIFGIGWTIGPTVTGYAILVGDSATPYWIFCILGAAASVLSVIYRKRLSIHASSK